MLRIRRHDIEPRQASSGASGLKPAVINSRHKASTGTWPHAVIPAAVQVSPINSARNRAACGGCGDGLAIELVRSAIETLLRAPKAAPTVGGAAFWAGIDHFGFCRAVSLRSIVRFESHSRACSAGKMTLRVDKRVTGGASPTSSSRSIVRSEQRQSRANSRFVRNSSLGDVSDIRALRLRHRLRGVTGRVLLSVVRQNTDTNGLSAASTRSSDGPVAHIKTKRVFHLSGDFLVWRAFREASLDENLQTAERLEPLAPVRRFGCAGNRAARRASLSQRSNATGEKLSVALQFQRAGSARRSNPARPPAITRRQVSLVPP